MLKGSHAPVFLFLTAPSVDRLPRSSSKVTAMRLVPSSVLIILRPEVGGFGLGCGGFGVGGTGGLEGGIDGGFTGLTGGTTGIGGIGGLPE